MATGTIPLVVEYPKKSNNFPSQKKVSYGEKCFGDNVAVILLKKDRPCRYNWETYKKHCQKRVSLGQLTLVEKSTEHCNTVFRCQSSEHEQSRSILLF